MGGATIDDLVANGASLIRAQDKDIGWTVMADPEGNEFCVFADEG
ncbi:VOC family protein [Aeromicrobium sp.]